MEGRPDATNRDDGDNSYMPRIAAYESESACMAFYLEY